jgi:hypothetical protein
VLGKLLFKFSILVGVDMAVISEEILTDVSIRVNLTSDITLVGSILATNKTNITIIVYYIVDISTYTVVHIATLVNYILTTRRDIDLVVTVLKLPSL